MWHPSFYSFKEALKIAEENGLETLPSAAQAIFLGNYLAEWDYVENIRPGVLAKLTDTVRVGHVPELHPWVSISIPMAPQVMAGIEAVWTPTTDVVLSHITPSPHRPTTALTHQSATPPASNAGRACVLGGAAELLPKAAPDRTANARPQGELLLRCM
jgi:hypothetical protein